MFTVGAVLVYIAVLTSGGQILDIYTTPDQEECQVVVNDYRTRTAGDPNAPASTDCIAIYAPGTGESPVTDEAP